MTGETPGRLCRRMVIMRKLVMVALVALVGCGGSPVGSTTDGGHGVDSGPGFDAGWPESGVTPTDCTPGDGPCCSGSGYFMLAGTPCGSGPLVGAECVAHSGAEWTEGRVRLLVCSGTSSACSQQDVMVDLAFRCRWGCSNAAPDCTSEELTGCYAPGEVASVVCRGVDYLGEF